MKKSKTELTRDEIIKKYFIIENEINALNGAITNLSKRELGQPHKEDGPTNFAVIVQRIELLKKACDHIHEAHSQTIKV